MLHTMGEQGIPTEGARVQPMGVDLAARFTPDPSVCRSSSDMLFVGRLVEKKGLRYLLEAMPAIIDSHPDVRLTIAGFGPEGPALRRKAKALEISRHVRFLGAVPQDELPALYRHAALFVAPFVEAETGDQEGLGLVTVEAIGCGCSVLVSDLPAVSDVVTDSRMRVPPADAEKLARAVSTCLARPKAERQEESEHMRRSVLRRFDWQSRTMAYSNLLKAISNTG